MSHGGHQRSETLATLFDATYYRRRYPDVSAAGVDPLTHFLSVGWAEGRNPSALFDTEFYFERSADVMQAGVNPLLHYIDAGAREGRRVSLLFDADWYLINNPDIEPAARANPLAHYLTSGAAQGREANPLFDQAWYLARYPYALAQARTALEHYAEFGFRDRLSPHPSFDGEFYLTRYPDVAGAGMNPLAHYLLQGHLESRQTKPDPETEAREEAQQAAVTVSEASLEEITEPEEDSSEEHTTPPTEAGEDQTIIKPLFHIEAASIDETGFGLVTGWLEGLDSSALRIRSGASQHYIESRLLTVRRADVAGHLLDIGKTPSATGDVFVLTFQAPSASDLLELIVTCSRQEFADMEIELQFERPLTRIEQVWRLGQATANRVYDFQALYEIAKPVDSEGPSVSEVLRFGPTDTPNPNVSVVIPFYGDWSFLLEHLIHQSLPGGDAMEWVFVCDDPSIQTAMRQFLMSRQSMIRAPTKLVMLSSNGGYGRANNLGVQHSSGTLVLLLNSDVYMRSVGPVLTGVTLLQTDDTIGAVGFTLLFEDGTIQHDGIAFEPLAEWNSLFVATHPYKGSPAQRLPDGVGDRSAVTGAAMLLRKADFLRLNGFDPAYVFGDFEDADLCLRLRMEGRRIVVVQNREMFHLERQSFRYASNVSRRTSMTLANCILFNARWRERLTQERADK